MTSADDKVIVWKLNAAQPRWASVRYRCVLPMLNLREMGYR